MVLHSSPCLCVPNSGLSKWECKTKASVLASMSSNTTEEKDVIKQLYIKTGSVLQGSSHLLALKNMEGKD